jgi:hypothetical protein
MVNRNLNTKHTPIDLKHSRSYPYMLINMFQDWEQSIKIFKAIGLKNQHKQYSKKPKNMKNKCININQVFLKLALIPLVKGLCMYRVHAAETDRKKNLASR